MVAARVQSNLVHVWRFGFQTIYHLSKLYVQVCLNGYIYLCVCVGVLVCICILARLLSTLFHSIPSSQEQSKL